MHKTQLFARSSMLLLGALLMSCGGGGGGGGSGSTPPITPPATASTYQWTMVNGNIVLIDPANANGAITVDRIGASTAITTAAYTGSYDAASQSFNGVKERFAVYARFGEIYKVDLLKQTAPPVALRVSNEAAFTNCGYSNYDLQIIQDFVSPEKSWVVYATFAAANGVTDCTTLSGYKAVRLDDAPTQAPRTMDVPVAALRNAATGAVSGYVGYFNTAGVINHYDAAMSNPTLLYGVAGSKVTVPVFIGQTKDTLLFGALNPSNTADLLAPAAYHLTTATWTPINPAMNASLPYEFLSFDGAQLFGAQKSSAIPIAPAQTSYELFKISIDGTTPAQRFATVNDLQYVFGSCANSLRIATNNTAGGNDVNYWVPFSGSNTGVLGAFKAPEFLPSLCNGNRIYGRAATQLGAPRTTLEVVSATDGTSARSIANASWVALGSAPDGVRYIYDGRVPFVMYKKVDSATNLNSFIAIDTATDAEIKLGEFIGGGMNDVSGIFGTEGLLVVGGKPVLVNGVTQATYDIYRYDMSKANSLSLVAAAYR